MNQPKTTKEMRQFIDLMRTDPSRYLQIVNEWLDDDPKDTWALDCRHSVWMHLDEPQHALDDLNKAIEIQPGIFNYVGRGKILRHLGQYEGALDDFARAEALDTTDWDAGVAFGLLYQADAHACLGNEAAALACCARLPDGFWTPGMSGAPAGNKSEVAAMLRLVASQARARRGGEASAPRRANDMRSVAWPGFANAPRRAHQQPSARGGKTKQPQTPEEMRQFADLLRCDTKRYLEIVNTWLGEDPQNAWALGCRHCAWMRMGEPERALDDINEAVEIAPDAVNVLSRGIVHRHLGEYDRALKDFAASEAIDPKGWPTGVGLLYQADTHARLGDGATAAAYCARLPDNFWTPGLGSMPCGSKSEVTAKLRLIAALARARQD